MNMLEEEKGWLPSAPAYITKCDEGDKLISFERAGLVFAFNFHPTKSFCDYPLDTKTPGSYQVILHTDEARFGGHKRVGESSVHFTKPDPTSKRGHVFLV
jgi:1,4-alpha-glucan branching enzyme